MTNFRAWLDARAARRPTSRTHLLNALGWGGLATVLLLPITGPHAAWETAVGWTSVGFGISNIGNAIDAFFEKHGAAG